MSTEEFDVTAVPVPDYLASADDSETFDAAANATTVPDDQPRRKRILGGNRPPTPPGSKDSAPRSERAKAAKTAKPEKPLPPIPAKGFAPGVEKMYMNIAMAVMPFDMQASMVIAEMAPQCAVAWDDLARQNHAVRRMLVAMMQTTAVGALFAAHMPLMAMVMMRAMKDDPHVSMIGEMLARQMHPDNMPDNGESDAA